MVVGVELGGMRADALADGRSNSRLNGIMWRLEHKEASSKVMLITRGDALGLCSRSVRTK